MLLFLSRIFITPYKILVNIRHYVLGGIVIVCILYQVSVSYTIIVGKQKMTIPILYESDKTEYESNNLKMINEIKNTSLFKTLNNKKYEKNLKKNAGIIKFPPYTGFIKLVGILKYSEESNSIAILELNGKQNLYFVGDKIENGTSITIIRILNDKVVINENESYYSLTIL